MNSQYTRFDKYVKTVFYWFKQFKHIWGNTMVPSAQKLRSHPTPPSLPDLCSRATAEVFNYYRSRHQDASGESLKNIAQDAVERALASALFIYPLVSADPSRWHIEKALITALTGCHMSEETARAICGCIMSVKHRR